MSTSMATRSVDCLIDVYDQGDYPIVLGDTLKDQSRSRSRYLQLKYNWIPSGSFHRHKGVLREVDEDVELSYTASDESSSTPAYQYSGYLPSNSDDKNREDNTRLVLVFDETKSAFVLEEVSTLVELNLTTAAGMKRDEIRSQQQLKRTVDRRSVRGPNGGKSDDDDQPDPSNPFDFRHFLAEARESGEKTSQPPSSKTPIPGSSTPLGRVASPSMSGGRFANTPSFMPTSAPTVISKKQTTDRPAPTSVPTKKAPARRKDAPHNRVTQALSKERISDSDEEVSDTITVAPKTERGHARNTSSADTAAPASKIVISEGGLEIDDGSPPQEPRRRYKIDPEAFRSQTHTPIHGPRTNRAPAQRSRYEDAVMKDAEDDDDDVDEFELESPHTRKDDPEVLKPVETPPGPELNDDVEDDALLAELMEAEIMEALEEQESASVDGDGRNYGHVDDDESEISEEE